MADRKDYVEIVNEVLDKSEYAFLNISYILSKKTDNKEIIQAVAYKKDDPDIIIGVEIDEDTKLSKYPEWAFNMDDYLFDDLQKGFEIRYMPLEEHYGIWCCIDEWRDDINSQDGMQKYLGYCQRKGINVKTLSLLEVEVKDVMDLYQETNGGYKILTDMSIGNNAIVLAHNPKSPSPYVTWETAADRNWGYQTGHYFTKYQPAFDDFVERCKGMFENNMRFKKEQSRSKQKKEHQYER